MQRLLTGRGRRAAVVLWLASIAACEGGDLTRPSEELAGSWAGQTSVVRLRLDMRYQATVENDYLSGRPVESGWLTYQGHFTDARLGATASVDSSRVEVGSEWRLDANLSLGLAPVRTDTAYYTYSFIAQRHGNDSLRGYLVRLRHPPDGPSGTSAPGRDSTALTLHRL